MTQNHVVAVDGFYECNPNNGLRHYETDLFHITDQEDSAHCIICRTRLKYPKDNSNFEKVLQAKVRI